MGVRTALVRWLGRDLLSEVAQEAAKRAVAEAVLPGGWVDPDEKDWRPLGVSPRDLPKLGHTQAQEVCYELYKSNPLGHRITELTRDFTVGPGLRWSARNPNVEDVVGDFWDDDENDLDGRLPDFALELGLYGELAPEVFVGGRSGVVKLGYIDPSQIKDVYTVEGNPLVLDYMKIKKKGFGVSGKRLEIVRRRRRKLTGDVFFFRVNSVSNATRGWPDLLHIADWLDAYDEFLWEVLERARMLRAFIWDVTVKGADQTEIENRMRREGAAPRSGTVRFHNQQEEWDAVAPQTGSFEMAKEGQILLEHIAGGAGFPKTWLASAEDVNRATAREMGTPVERKLVTRQTKFVHAVRNLLRFVLEKAADKGRLKTNDRGLVQVYDSDGKETEIWLPPHRLVEIHAPEVSPRDVVNTGPLIQSVAQALAIAANQKWIAPRVGTQVLALILKHIGFDADPDRLAGDVDRAPEEEESTEGRTGLEEANGHRSGEESLALKGGHPQ